jgi:hypothetical protein
MNRLTLLAACCLALSLTNCKKTNDNASTPSSTTELNRLYSALKSTPQSFTVTAGSATKIYGAKGTIISFYPNSFKDKNGAVISSGTVNVDLVEMYSVGDMIANRATTAMSNGVLISGGQVNIKATIGGEEVYANKYGLGFITSTQQKPMELYYGSNGSEVEVTWTMTDTTNAGTKARNAYVTDKARQWMEQPFYFFDSSDKFNFVNCDHAYDSTCKYVTIKANTNNSGFTSSNTSLWVCYPAKKVVICLHSWESNAGTITYKGYAPVGPSCRIVVLTNNYLDNADNFFYSDQTSTLTDNMTINATMTSETVSSLKAKLSALK